MSWIFYDPDEYRTVCETSGHEHPGLASCSIRQERRSAEEIAAIKAERRALEEGEILRRADAIRARRASAAPSKPLSDRHAVGE